MGNNDEKFIHEIEELKSDFASVLLEKLSDLEALVLDLHKGDSEQNAENFKNLIREIHSIKGSSGSYQLQFVSKVCHRCEDYLQEKTNSANLGEEYEDVILKHLDLINHYLEAIIANETIDETKYNRKLNEIRVLEKSEIIRVLIVEPTKSILRLYQKSLEEFNCQFYYTSNGLAALERILSIPYDFLITSKNIDAINGPELIGCLNILKEKRPKLKTVLVSSNEYTETDLTKKSDYFVLKDKDIGLKLNKIIKERNN